ncbi:MAG: hypothetical protein K6A97_09250 [Lachnospiraceae bacterium]|nr:hypothetical protein [Lachnospiraceae bacterium]
MKLAFNIKYGGVDVVNASNNNRSNKQEEKMMERIFKSKIMKVGVIMCIMVAMIMIASDKMYAGSCLYLNEGRPHNYDSHVFLSGRQYSEWNTVYVEYDPYTLKPVKIYQSRSVTEVYVHECVCGESRLEYRTAAPETRTLP